MDGWMDGWNRIRMVDGWNGIDRGREGGMDRRNG